MSFYEKGQVRIHYEEAGAGFPLLIIPGGGLNASTIASLSTSAHPFDPIAEFKGEYRCIAADLRNAGNGQSSGPLEVDRHPYAVAMAAAMLAPNAEVSMFPWKEPKERIPLAVRQIHSFLRAHRPVSS